MKSLMETLKTEMAEGDGNAVPAASGEDDTSLEKPEASRKRKRTEVMAASTF